MPPQQGERLLDLADDRLDFGAHGRFLRETPGERKRRARRKKGHRETGRRGGPLAWDRSRASKNGTVRPIALSAERGRPPCVDVRLQSRSAPPTLCIGSEFEDCDLRIGLAFRDPVWPHLPRDNLLSGRADAQKMCLAEDENRDRAGFVNHYGEVGVAPKRATRRVELFEVVVLDIYRCPFSINGPGARLHGNAHEFGGMWVSGDYVQADVINVGALEPVLRQPVQHEAFREVARDLRVACAFY